MFNGLLHARADSGLGPQPRTKHEMREAGEDDDFPLPLNFDHGRAGQAHLRRRKASAPDLVHLPRRRRLWQRHPKHAPDARPQMMDGALERAAPRRSSTIGWPNDELTQRRASLEHVLREQSKDLASIELQENGMLALASSLDHQVFRRIFMIVYARPWIVQLASRPTKSSLTLEQLGHEFANNGFVDPRAA